MMRRQQWIQEAWEQVVAKIERTSKRIGATHPHVTREGKYDDNRPSHWVSGFWPGLLWLLYRDTRNEAYAEIARQCEKKISEALIEYEQLHHDVGFIYGLSSVSQYVLLGDKAARKHGLMAANLLAGRFNVHGNFIRAWHDWDGENHSGWSIIDSMMNIPLLYWASNEMDDPRYTHIAVKHADTILREFVRPDGSTHHIVCFDAQTGERTSALGGQGYSEASAWSRGASWAIYGFALSYKYTKEIRFLDAAKQTAHFFLANLPEDHVPHWDFRVPSREEAPRDSSAGACAASGLLEIADLVNEEEAELYRSAALRILHSLYENYGAWDDPTEEGLLLHATGEYPRGVNVDVSLMYGDYYFVEALAKLRGGKPLFW